MRKRLTSFTSLFVLACLLLIAAGGLYAQIAPRGEAYAGAKIVGQRNGADMRALVGVNGSDRVWEIIYVSSGSHASAGANTPVTSSAFCDLPGVYHYAQFDLTGTLAGTNPTLAILWQNSKDNGSTWSNVGTWTTVNATVTPATQSQTVADHGDIVLMNANTPVTTPAVTYGDCWRVRYTFAGTGNPAGNFKITGMEK